jgi:hypothetical protein
MNDLRYHVRSDLILPELEDCIRIGMDERQHFLFRHGTRSLVDEKMSVRT